MPADVAPVAHPPPILSPRDDKTDKPKRTLGPQRPASTRAGSKTPWARAVDFKEDEDKGPSPRGIESGAPLLSPRQLHDTPPPGCPEDYLCQLTGRLLRDPVVASDGRSYERLELEAFVRENNNVSPQTGAPIDARVYPNNALRNLIRAAYPSQTPTAASKPGPRSFDFADRRIRFQEEQEKNPKCQGRIEWFMSKPDLGGYGEIVPDGGLEAAIGKILIHEAQLGRNVPTSGARVAFRIQKSQEEKGRAIAVDVEIVQPTTTRNAPQSTRSLAPTSTRSLAPSSTRSAATARGFFPNPSSTRSTASSFFGDRPPATTPRNVRPLLRGHCTWFSGKFGFLRPVGGADDGQDDVFVHATAVEHFPGGQVHADDYVEFKVATHNNRPRAVDVVLLQASDAAY